MNSKAKSSSSFLSLSCLNFQPITSWSSKTAFNSLSHHQNKPIFASSASSIQIWDLARGAISSGSETSALQNLSWGAESINVVKFNPSETEVLVSAGSDRGVLLYDLRSGKPITKMIMKASRRDRKGRGMRRRI